MFAMASALRAAHIHKATPIGSTSMMFVAKMSAFEVNMIGSALDGRSAVADARSRCGYAEHRQQRENREMQFLDPEDQRYRGAAFQHLQGMLGGGTTIAREAMAIPFFVGEDRCTLVDAQRGIHKPRHMKYLLSITTVVAARGRRIWYADQTSAHSDIYSEEAAASCRRP